MTTGPIAEQPQLLFFNAIFHLTPCAVKLVVEGLAAPLQVSEHVTGIGAPIAVFGLSNHSAFLVPSFGLVLELSEQSHLAAALSMLALSSSLEPGRQNMQALILGQPHDVTHSGPLAPAQHFPAAEATVSPQRDLYFWPALAQRLDHQGQHRPGMLSRIDVAFAQIADQKPFPTKDIQRQKTEVVVKAMKVPPLLQPVHSIVGTVKIQNQFLGSRFETSYELFEEHLMHQPGFFAPRAILQPAQRRTTG